jgi:asparagine synthase (glutamine-hydrolysing)
MHLVHLRPMDLPDRFQALVRAHDQPFSSPVVFAQYQVFEAVNAAGFKVMLSGQGPDEFLAGYHVSIAHRIASLARKGRVLSASMLLRRATQGGDVRTQDLLRPALGSVLPDGLKDRIRSLRRERLPARWLNAQWFEKRIPSVSPRSAVPGNGVFHSMLLRGIEHAPLPLMLRVEDRNSMAFSVENRLPFLTPEIVQFTLSLPEHHLISSSGTTKHVFREAMQGITPQAVLDRRDKMGFPVPLSSWLADVRPWAARTLESLEGVAPFHYPAIRQMLQNFTPGPTEFVPQAFLLWRLIFLAGWAQTFNSRFL